MFWLTLIIEVSSITNKKSSGDSISYFKTSNSSSVGNKNGLKYEIYA